MTAPIPSDAPNAVAQLLEKIEQAQKRQDVMRATNAIVRNRKLSDDEKVSRIVSECHFAPDAARLLLKPDELGRTGFPAYELTNNSANIRRMEERVKSLEAESGRASVTVNFPGGYMEDNADESRIRIFHDEKPPRDRIDQLKANGFHWSPRAACWQRLRNDNARYAAARITGVAWPGPEVAAPATTPTEIPAAPVDRNYSPRLSA